MVDGFLALGASFFLSPQHRLRKRVNSTFHVLVTTLDHDPVQTWRFYNSRAESENRIKELKQDFGADGFCLHSFDGTEAAFRLICFLFNLIADFKREVTQNEAPRLMTLRTRLLVIGAIRGARPPADSAPWSARSLAPTLCRPAPAHCRARRFGATPFRWTVLGLRLDFLFAGSIRS